jgi:hypothetical protein
MIFDSFEIHASPYICKAYCKTCLNSLVEISNGWLSRAMYCPKCENVYVLKLVKVPQKKISEEFLNHARSEVNKITKM